MVLGWHETPFACAEGHSRTLQLADLFPLDLSHRGRHTLNCTVPKNALVLRIFDIKARVSRLSIAGDVVDHLSAFATGVCREPILDHIIGGRPWGAIASADDVHVARRVIPWKSRAVLSDGRKCDPNSASIAFKSQTQWICFPLLQRNRDFNRRKMLIAYAAPFCRRSFSRA